MPRANVINSYQAPIVFYTRDPSKMCKSQLASFCQHRHWSCADDLNSVTHRKAGTLLALA